MQFAQVRLVNIIMFYISILLFTLFFIIIHDKILYCFLFTLFIIFFMHLVFYCIVLYIHVVFMYQESIITYLLQYFHTT